MIFNSPLRKKIFMVRCKCSWPIIHPSEEQEVMTKGFIAFNIIQFIAITILCSISINKVAKTNITSFFPVDLETLFIAIIFLAIILLVVGWSSARHNNTCTWSVFHAFNSIMLIVEIIVCLMSSNLAGFTKSFSAEWKKADTITKYEIQLDLRCCGLENITSEQISPCPQGATEGCLEQIIVMMTTIRNAASIAMFVCFTFGLFIDFLGCAICFHPDVINFEDHEKELAKSEGAFDIDSFENPFIAEIQAINI